MDGLSNADKEHYQLLHDFFLKHCPPRFMPDLVVVMDPEVVDFRDIVKIVCNLLGYAFL